MLGVGRVGDQLSEDRSDGRSVGDDEQRWGDQGLGAAHARTVVARRQRLPTCSSFVSVMVLGRLFRPAYVPVRHTCCSDTLGNIGGAFT